jgi:plastocyanin
MQTRHWILMLGLVTTFASVSLAQSKTVIIDGTRFSTREVRIKKGDRLVVANRSSHNHWIWGHGGDFAWDMRATSSNEFTHQPGQTHGITLHHPGVYRVGCAIHPHMRLKLVVEE